MIRHVETIEEFDELIKGEVIVDFYADWCGPCRMMGQTLETLEEKGELTLPVLKVNCDDLEDIAARYRVQSIPTLLRIKAGEVIKSSVGLLNPTQFKEFIK